MLAEQAQKKDEQSDYGILSLIVPGWAGERLWCYQLLGRYVLPTLIIFKFVHQNSNKI